jgi:hypothetical protein
MSSKLKQMKLQKIKENLNFPKIDPTKVRITSKRSNLSNIAQFEHSLKSQTLKIDEFRIASRCEQLKFRKKNEYKEILTSKETKSTQKKIKKKKMGANVFTNDKIKNELFSNELPINLPGILKQNTSKIHTNESKCNLVELDKIYCPRSPNKSIANVHFGWSTNIKTKAYDFATRSSTKSEEEIGLLVPQIIQDTKLPNSDETKAVLGVSKNNNYFKKRNHQYFQSCLITLEDLHKEFINKDNIEKHNFETQKKMIPSAKNNESHTSEIFIPRNTINVPNLKIDTMTKSTAHKNLNEVTFKKEQRWRKGKDALVELLHFDEYLTPNSTSSNERFYDVSTLENPYTLTNSLKSSNTTVEPIISCVEHFKVVEGKKRDFENLKNLGQDALTVSRSHNRTLMEKGKRKKIDKDIDERGCKMPKVVGKEESNHLDGIYHGLVDFNISNTNVHELHQPNCQQVQIEEGFVTENKNKSQPVKNDEILITEDAEKDQAIQDEELFELIQNDEASLVQNFEINHPLQHGESLIVQDVNRNQPIQNDKEFVCLVMNNNDDNHNSIITNNKIHEDFLIQNMNESFQDPLHNCITSKKNFIKENNNIQKCHSSQNKNHSNVIDTNATHKDIKSMNTHAFLTCEQRDVLKNVGNFSKLNKLFQNDLQSEKIIKEKDSHRNLKDVQKICCSLKQIRRKGSIKETKSHNQEKLRARIDSNKTNLQTKHSFIHGPKNLGEGLCDNNSFNLEISRKIHDENKKHISRKRGDDGLNMLLNEVRAKFHCIKGPVRNLSPNKRRFIGTPKQYFIQVQSTQINGQEIFKSNGLSPNKTNNKKLIEKDHDQSLKHAFHEEQPKRISQEHTKKLINPSICAKQNLDDIEMHATKIMESYLQEMNIGTRHGMNALGNTYKENKVHMKTKNKHRVDINKPLDINRQEKSSPNNLRKELEDSHINSFFSKRKLVPRNSSGGKKSPHVECHMDLKKDITKYKNMNFDASKKDDETKDFGYEDCIFNYFQKGLPQERVMVESSNTIPFNIAYCDKTKFKSNKGFDFEKKDRANSSFVKEVSQINSSLLQDSSTRKIFNKEKEHLSNSHPPVPESYINRIKSTNDVNDQVVPSLHHIQKTSQIAVEILDGIVKKFNSDHAQRTQQRKESEEFFVNKFQVEQCTNCESSNGNTKICSAQSIKGQELSRNELCNKNLDSNTTTIMTNLCNIHNNNISHKELNKVDNLTQKLVHHIHPNLALLPIDESFGEILERLTSNNILQYESRQKNVQRTTQIESNMQLSGVIHSQTSTNSDFQEQDIEEVQNVVKYKTQMEWEAKSMEVETSTHDLSTFSKSMNPKNFHSYSNENTINLMKDQNNDTYEKCSSNLDKHDLNYCVKSTDVKILNKDYNKINNFSEILEDVQCHFKNLHSFEIDDEVGHSEIHENKAYFENEYSINQNDFKQDFDNMINIGKTACEYYQSDIASKCQITMPKTNHSLMPTFLYPNKSNGVLFDEAKSPSLELGHTNIEKDLLMHENIFKCECIENGSNIHNCIKKKSLAHVPISCIDEVIFEDIINQDDEEYIHGSCEILSKGIQNDSIQEIKLNAFECFQLHSLLVDDINNSQNNDHSLSCDTFENFERIKLKMISKNKNELELKNSNIIPKVIPQIHLIVNNNNNNNKKLINGLFIQKNEIHPFI